MIYAPPHPGRILVVDDESHILHVLGLKLRRADFDVLTARDGEEGYETALEHRPNLIITDLQMPLMNGLEMCRKLRRSPATAQLPALMLSGRGFTLTDDDLQETNVVGIVTKPFSPQNVLEQVTQLTSADVPA